MSETFSLWHAGAGIAHVSSVVTDLTPPGHLVAISAGKRRSAGLCRRLKRGALDELDRREKVAQRHLGQQARH
jgi:hypothetical protein